MKVLAVRIPETLLAKLKIRAIEDRTTLQELVTEAVEARLTRKGGQR